MKRLMLTIALILALIFSARGIGKDLSKEKSNPSKILSVQTGLGKGKLSTVINNRQRRILQRSKSKIRNKELKKQQRKLHSPLSLFNNVRRQKRLPTKNYTKFTLPEFLLDTTISFGPAPDDQEFTDVAFDGTNYFVVWYDMRNDDIYGARVSRNGVLLDTLGIPICTEDDWQGYPSVAFDGTNYFVVWSDFRNWDYDIYGARVSPSGVVLDPQGIPICTAYDYQDVPAIKFDGTNYLVAWNDYRSDFNGDIYATRVTPTGVVLDPQGIPVSTASFQQFIFRGIGFDGTNYLITWLDDRDGDEYYDVYGARMTRAGIVLDPDGIPISVAPNSQILPRVAFDGTNYLVVWCDDRLVYEEYRIFGARVSPSGVVLDPQGIQITQNFGVYPAIVYNGTNYFVVWTELNYWWEGDIYGARVSTAGVVLDPQGLPISTTQSDQWLPSIVIDNLNDMRYFITWSDFRSWNNYDIYGARMQVQGTVLDPEGILLTYGYSSPEQYEPAVAFDGTNYFVVWSDSRNGNSIYGSRVTPSGIVLDPQGILISSAQYQAWAPSVTFDGTNYLVVWEDYRTWEGDIYGARVSTAGIVLDPLGIPISTAEYDQLNPSVAFDGTNYFVVWSDNREGEEYPDIYGARVSPSGVVLDPQGIVISSDMYDFYEQYNPRIVFDGTYYFVVWEINREGGYLTDIFGARVGKDGTVLDPYSIPIVFAQEEQHNPSISFDGTNYLVVWEDWRNWNSDIYGARVTRTGVVLNPNGFIISNADDDQWSPAVAFYGTNYLVVWADYRNWENSDIYGTRINTNGVVLDPQGIELINQPTGRSQPDLAKGPGSQLLLVFCGYIIQYGASKILGALYPSTGIMENNSLTIFSSPFKVSPNPCYKTTNIELTLTKETKISIELIDISGRCLKNFASGQFPVGNHKFRLNLENLSAGIYFLRVKTEEKTLTERIVKMR
ncbi:MAG: T9SS type A sorting domain-containing protein [candidate division WOR-3 bacterium]|nr:T9SS type A sorting domain-containing protein [candidate division WOR-3 bacterium]